MNNSVPSKGRPDKTRKVGNINSCVCKQPTAQTKLFAVFPVREIKNKICDIVPFDMAVQC